VITDRGSVKFGNRWSWVIGYVPNFPKREKEKRREKEKDRCREDLKNEIFSFNIPCAKNNYRNT